jgi:signal transduction histidine kinase
MRRRLIVVFVAVTTLVAAAFVIPLAVLVRNVARERALDDASRDASALSPVLAVSEDAEALRVAISRTRSGSDGRLTVFLASGAAIGGRADATEHVVAGLRDGRAFSGSVSNGAEIVSPVVRSNGTISVVRVFVPTDELRKGVVRAWLALGGVGVALVVASVLLADRLARSVTRPMTALADASHRLGDGDLSARVDPEGPPEIADVGTAFNVLARRVEGLLHAEREDVADLAHRLRTPLTALRLQIDQVHDPRLRHQLAQSADGLARSLDQLIVEARRVAAPGSAACDAREVTIERAAFWQALADEQARRTRVDVPAGEVLVPVNGDELAAAIDVLVENVFVHTPDGTPYEIALTASDGAARLVIADAGPGFPHLDVVARGESGGSSTGLGLDIARRTAEHAGGRLVIGTAGTGHVELVVPLVSG